MFVSKYFVNYTKKVDCGIDRNLDCPYFLDSPQILDSPKISTILKGRLCNRPKCGLSIFFGQSIIFGQSIWEG
jgi:hypothetical protein